ncbi:uncharacterized protein LOC142356358, partial [Convolutriloba macropyga]|uniref:uncharacterized protein LOC142356358 n=1 Tax=Convolutriloba macropyga TaxID=536237 RepID=UPI003F527594
MAVQKIIPSLYFETQFEAGKTLHFYLLFYLIIYGACLVRNCVECKDPAADAMFKKINQLRKDGNIAQVAWSDRVAALAQKEAEKFICYSSQSWAAFCIEQTNPQEGAIDGENLANFAMFEWLAAGQEYMFPGDITNFDYCTDDEKKGLIFLQ